MRILLLASHAVAEYDDIRMFSHLGYDVFCPGGYEQPAQPAEGIRPAVPIARDHPELRQACHEVRARKASEGQGTDWAIDWAKAELPQAVLDWADVIICHHFPERWLVAPWARLRDKRVIWRTCGQSSPELEQYMAPLVADGLEVVRYSPYEREAFSRWGAFAGETAMIRFGKFISDWWGWQGDDPVIGNVTQNMRQRGPAVGLDHWERLTAGLPRRPAGPGSEELEAGLGRLEYDALRSYLTHLAAYLYTGTSPASYTLGLIEAMAAGVPVVSIRAEDFGPAAPLFEAPALIGQGHRDPRRELERLLADRLYAEDQSLDMAYRAREFSVIPVGAAWKRLLGEPTSAATVPQEARA